MPTSEKDIDQRTGRIVHTNLSEFERRSKYMQRFAQIPDLRRLVEQCLSDAPRERPEVHEVSEHLKIVNYPHLPHEDNSILELFDSLINCEEQLEERGRTEEEDESIPDPDYWDIVMKRHNFYNQQSSCLLIRYI